MGIETVVILSLKIIGVGVVGMGASAIASAFHQYSYKLTKKGGVTNEIESLREKSRSLN